MLFYFFDEFAIRLFDKFEINIRNEKIELDRQDYEYSAKKLENTIKLLIWLSYENFLLYQFLMIK